MSNSHYQQRVKLDSLTVQEKVKIIITPEFKKQIDHLHNKIGSTEWCGCLITKDEGSILNPGEMVITPQHIYIMDIGSSAYTEAQMGLNMIDMYERYPEIESGEWRIHMVH